eukprot:5403053-Prymnesium_polylepis.1
MACSATARCSIEFLQRGRRAGCAPRPPTVRSWCPGRVLRPAIHWRRTLAPCHAGPRSMSARVRRAHGFVADGTREGSPSCLHTPSLSDRTPVERRTNSALFVCARWVWASSVWVWASSVCVLIGAVRCVWRHGKAELLCGFRRFEGGHFGGAVAVLDDARRGIAASRALGLGLPCARGRGLVRGAVRLRRRLGGCAVP